MSGMASSISSSTKFSRILSQNGSGDKSIGATSITGDFSPMLSAFLTKDEELGRGIDNEKSTTSFLQSTTSLSSSLSRS